MIYKKAVCDDEQVFVDEMVEKIKEQSEQCEIFEYASGDELLNSSFEFNIVFLDIEMTGIDSINPAFALFKLGYDEMIIFLTSHTKFVLDTFRVIRKGRRHLFLADYRAIAYDR